jgi:exportin-1
MASSSTVLGGSAPHQPQHEYETLLTNFNIPLLDRVLASVYAPNDPNQAMANSVLMKLQAACAAGTMELWTQADAIMEQSTNPFGRFFGLQILESAIQSRWNIMSAPQKEGIKNYIVGKIIQCSTNATPGNAGDQRAFLSKLNITLIAILKHEWPHNWPTFISDLVNSSQTSESLCENNLQILKMLSEEVFDFSKDVLVTEKIKRMKESLNSEFSSIYHLCEFVLEHGANSGNSSTAFGGSNAARAPPSLIRVCLETLQRFLTWIPLDYIFQTSLIHRLIHNFFPNPAYRNEALDCLTEIATLTDLTTSPAATSMSETTATLPGAATASGSSATADQQQQFYNNAYRQLLTQFMTRLSDLFSPETNLQGAYESGSESDKQFLQKLALFLSGLFKTHLAALETPESHQTLITAMYYLIRISEIKDTEIFRICLEAWHMLAEDLYKSDVASIRATNSLEAGGLRLSNGGIGGLNLGPKFGSNSINGNGSSQAQNRKVLYASVLTGVRQVMIASMAKPEEVLILEDENGDLVRETTKDTDVIAQYKTMRDALVYLTHLNSDDTEAIMLAKLTELEQLEYIVLGHWIDIRRDGGR